MVINGLLAAAADLALSPKSRGTTPAEGDFTKFSNVDITNSASVGARMSSELLQTCSLLSSSPDPLAAAALPFDAIRAAVAMLMGQSAELRSAGRILLSCQALGVSRKSEVVGSEVWTNVCAVPDATLAALKGAADAVAAAMELSDASLRVNAASWCVFHCKSLIPCAMEASMRGAIDDLWRKCVIARAALARDVWDLCVGVISGSRHLAGESFSQGDLVRVFQCLPDVFNLWYKGASEAKDKPLDPNADEVYEDDVFESLARGAHDEFSALSWLQDCVRWGSTELTPAVANHWMKALESSLEAATGPLKIAKIDRLPFTAKEAAKEVFNTLRGKQAERLAKWFPEEAPGNLGVGMLDALPARRDQTDQSARPSIRERLQALSTPLGRTLEKGGGRAPAPGSKDALDAWNAERGGFADYPRDEEDDYGSEEDKEEDDNGVIDLLSPGSTRGASGLGTALGGGSNWQATYSFGPLWGQPKQPPALPSDGKSPYERAMEKAQRNKSSRRTTAPMTDGDILANIRAGGPTHKRAPTKSASRGGVSTQDARMAANAQQNLAELHRERTALAQKREAERSAAKAARLARLADRRGDASVIDLVTDEGGDRRAKALAALENAERIRKTATITPVVKASSRSAAIRRPLLGSNNFVPPWTPPKLEDLIGAALRWSMGHIKSARIDQERTGSFARLQTFTSTRQYIEHFAPLMLAELRAQLASALDESGGNPPGVPLPATVDQLVGNERSYHSLRINLGRTAVGDAFLENDLVLIEKQRPASQSTTHFPTPHCLAWVEAVESGARAGKSQASDGGSGVCLRVKVCLVENPDETVQWLTGNGGGSLNRDKEVQRRCHMLRALSRHGGSLKLSRLSSLTTVLREMQALVHVQKIPVFKALLQPSGTAWSSSKNLDIAPDRIGISTNAWSTIAASLNGPQVEAVHTAAAASACKYSRRTLVESSTAATRQLVLIQGPPGTGKTHTIASLVQAALHGNQAVLNGKSASRMRRVLVCAQSNSAVDELVVRLADRIDAARYGDRRLSGVADDTDADDRRSLVRLGREDAVRTDALPYLVTRAVDSNIRPNDTAVGEREKEVSIVQSRLERLSKDIKHATSLAEGQENDSEQSIHLQMLQAQRRRLLGELAIMRQKQRKQRDGAKSAAGSAWTRVVGGAEIVCATLSGAGLLAADRTGARAGGRGKGGVKHVTTSEEAESAMVGCAVPLFDLIIVDEAAQATEAATLVPLRWLRPGGAAVFVGDPQQLAATVLSRGSAKRSIEQSMFERLQSAGAHTHLLSVQYRMHSEIRQFPSNAFYGGRLVDGNGVPNGPLGDLGAYVAFDVAEGYEQRGRFSGQSLSNAAEASLAAVLYMKMLSRSDVSRRVTVGVVTPYKDQIAELRRKFEPIIKGRPEARVTPVEFATVDGVQGREFDVVIFSCVRAIQGVDAAPVDLTDEFEYMDNAEAAAHSRRMIGFLSDRRRLNVALTRPKRALFVLGNAATLRRADEIWSLFWADAEKRGVAVRALQPYGLHSFDRWERIEYVPADIIKVEEKQQVRSPEVKVENDVKGSDSVVDLTLDEETDAGKLATEPPGRPTIGTHLSSKPVKRRPNQSDTPSWLHEPVKPKKAKIQSTGAERIRPVQALQMVPKSRSTGKTTTYRAGDATARPSAAAIGAGPTSAKIEAMRKRADAAAMQSSHERRVSVVNKKPPPGGLLNSILKGMKKET
uniref:AAA+ ATPase domain-containing protein n=1 Tax=Micromonas pusilla TaxID=38833 RepID=A0A6U2CFQ3_MICPS|mmetsp:Transcript_2188/g.8309  ORF Transcript_2188/g.8309 Transcript_2188/m.8309 type:complete len:1712 (+) Transcript_2188:30-5165(+)